MTPEEQLIQRYFDAFNRHDIEGVMACYHEEPVIIGANGKRCAVARRSGARTSPNSPCFPTGVAICACAPATAAAAWPSRSSTEPTQKRGKVRRSARK